MNRPVAAWAALVYTLVGVIGCVPPPRVAGGEAGAGRASTES